MMFQRTSCITRRVLKTATTSRIGRRYQQLSPTLIHIETEVRPTSSSRVQAVVPQNVFSQRWYHATTSMTARKPGVATDEEMDAFLAKHGPENIVVIDARSADESIVDGPVAETGAGTRPNALNLPWDRANKTLTSVEKLPADKSTPLISHCGGGGRGQKTRVYLEEAGYTNVLNGGGPEVPELWGKFGSL